MISWRLILVVVGTMLVAALLLDNENEAMSQDTSSTPVVKKALRRQVRVPIPDFSLMDQVGKPFQFHTLRGKAVLLAFVYTTCPDVCPLITASMRSVQENLKDRERNLVFLLSITTDPEVDNPKVLKSYGERYGVDFFNWSFLTGEFQTLAPVWKAFGVRVERKARGLVSHTSLTALIDAQGVMRFAYIGTFPDQGTILRDMRSLLGSR